MNYLEKKKKAMLNAIASGGRLPSEYQEVEWVGSSGTQYIDIDVIPNDNTKLEMTFEPNVWSGISYTVSASGSSSANYFGIGFREGAIVMYYTGYPLINNVYSLGNRLKASLESMSNVGYLEVENLTTQQTFSLSRNGTINSTTPLAIFCFHLSNNRIEKAEAKLYEYKITQNGSVVSEGVPCYRKSDNEIGMYDTVNQTFYTNAGTGTFTKGNDV